LLELCSTLACASIARHHYIRAIWSEFVKRSDETRTAPVWHQILSWRLGYGRGKEGRLLDEVDLDDAERRMKTSRSAFS
jgi:hypothetical protein